MIARVCSVLAIGLLLSAMLLAPACAWAQAGTVERPQQAEILKGELEFRLYCVQCHGFEGVGNGPVAPALRTRPANLRMLARNRGGVFPEQEVRDFIDGTKQLAAHGTRDMPIWGLAFSIGAAPSAIFRLRRRRARRKWINGSINWSPISNRFKRNSLSREYALSSNTGGCGYSFARTR